MEAAVVVMDRSRDNNNHFFQSQENRRRDARDRSSLRDHSRLDHCNIGTALVMESEWATELVLDQNHMDRC